MLSHQNRDGQDVFMITKEVSAEATVRNIRYKTRRKFAAEEGSVSLSMACVVISPSLSLAVVKA